MGVNRVAKAGKSVGFRVVVEGAEQASDLTGVVRVSLAVKPGDLLSDVGSSRERHGYVLAVGDTLRSVETILSEAFSRITIATETE